MESSLTRRRSSPIHLVVWEERTRKIKTKIHQRKEKKVTKKTKVSSLLLPQMLRPLHPRALLLLICLYLLLNLLVVHLLTTPLIALQHQVQDLLQRCRDVKKPSLN